MRRKILIVLAFLLVVSGYKIWKASTPVFLGGHGSRGALGVEDRSGTRPRFLGGFSIQRGHVRHWFKDKPFISLIGLVCEGVEGKTFSSGSRSGSNIGVSNTDWIVNIGTPGEHVTEPLNSELEIIVRFNVDENSVTLLNTGEVIAFDSDEVFTVFVNKDLQITKFDTLDPDAPQPTLDPLLQENFKGVMGRRKEIIEESFSD